MSGDTDGPADNSSQSDLSPMLVAVVKDADDYYIGKSSVAYLEYPVRRLSLQHLGVKPLQKPLP